MEYMIVSRIELQDLANAVAEMIEKGFIPQGGIAISESFVAQAMIKK